MNKLFHLFSKNLHCLSYSVFLKIDENIHRSVIFKSFYCGEKDLLEKMEVFHVYRT